jgi:iron complex outermembrane receptor protein
MRLGISVYNIFNEEYENNGYAGSGYYIDEDGNKQIYRYAGYAAQAPIHLMGSISINI